MTITVLDGHTLNPDGDNPWTPLESLGRLVVHPRTPPGQTIERARDSEVVLTNKVALDAATLGALPKLKYVGVLATGYNVVDVAAATARGVVVTNIPAYSTDSVAQHTFALLLALTNKVAEHDAAVKAGRWQDSPDFSFTLGPLPELAGKTMGVVGYGRIGRAVGRVARALGMRVVANTRTRPKSSEPARNARAELSAIDRAPHFDDGTDWLPLELLFAQSDVVTLHCPQTPENTGFVNRALLGRMKPTALLLNTARGGLVNEADLAAALAAGAIAGAAVDVVSEEPIVADNPLLGAPNLVITPHVAWASVAARRRLMQIAADNVAAFLAGKPVNVVS